MHNAGTAADSVTEVVSVPGQPRETDGFPGLYATSLPEQLFQTSERALLTSQWTNTTQVMAVDFHRGSACKWGSSAGADESSASTASCAVLSSFHGEICYPLLRIDSLSCQCGLRMGRCVLKTHKSNMRQRVQGGPSQATPPQTPYPTLLFPMLPWQLIGVSQTARAAHRSFLTRSAGGH